MDELKIKWITKQIKKLVDYIADRTPLDDKDFEELAEMVGEITKAAKGNDQVRTIILGVLEVIDRMYQ